MALSNTGNQGWMVLLEKYVDDGTSAGRKMPNILNISPDAIVPNSAAITFNAVTSPSPTGGSNGDVWYNKPSDMLYKKVGGVWGLLSNKVINASYAPPIQNLTSCPL